MKTISNLFCGIFFLFIIGCSNQTHDNAKEFRLNPDKIQNVSTQINSIQTDVYFNFADLKVIDNHLIINELNPKESKAIHIFDLKSEKHLTSVGKIGRGPNEITRIGYLGANEPNRVFWVTDHGKHVRWKFPLDSVINNHDFKPKEKLELKKDFFLINYDFLEDSIAIGIAVEPTSNNSMVMKPAKLNIKSRKTKPYGYMHPDLEKKYTYSCFALSKKNNCYVIGYNYADLLTVCNLDGTMKCNIYGPKWRDKEEDKGNKYFIDLFFYKNYIITSYLGTQYINKHSAKTANYPTKLLVFDINGNHVKTIETGHEFSSFCVDEKNERIIAYFEDLDNPLGHFKIEL